MTGNAGLSCSDLLVAASQAHCSYFLLIGLFRYFIFAHAQGRRYDRSLAVVTTKNGEVKVLFFHQDP
jgi:hypothetical protein